MENENKKQKRCKDGENESVLKSIKNRLFEEQQAFLQSIPKEAKNHFFSNNGPITPDERAELWTKQADFGERMVNKYAWATPDERAIKIIKYFAPIVEVGCGRNAYWANTLKENGVDIIAYDFNVDSGGIILQNDEEGNLENVSKSIQVKQGGPEILSHESIFKSKRTLMLCYPDEDFFVQEPIEESNIQPEHTSLGIECLEHFKGDHIIHIGELYSDTLSMEQTPWGRSSSSQFQERLAGEYHCLLKASLPSWLHVRDTISVWKRSERCSIVFEGEIDEDTQEKEEDEEVEYKYIPIEERIPVDVAAPCVKHLL